MHLVIQLCLNKNKYSKAVTVTLEADFQSQLKTFKGLWRVLKGSDVTEGDTSIGWINIFGPQTLKFQDSQRSEFIRYR